MGFKVRHDEPQVTLFRGGEIIDIRAHLHEKLDELIELMISNGGAECRVTIDQGGEEFALRLTLCDFTGEELCARCDGTGVKPTETSC